MKILSSLYEAPPDCIPINHGAGGLGDSLLGLCVVNGLRHESGREVAYAVRGSNIDFCALFDGCDYLATHTHDQNRPEPPDHFVQMNLGYDDEVAAQGKVQRWRRYMANVGATQAPIIPKLREPGRLLRLMREYAGCVVLAPYSTAQTLTWRLESWLTLEKLLRRSGYRTVVVDSGPPERTKDFRGDVRRNVPADQLVALCLNAAAVIGNDSGIAHLGGILGIPTLALCGPTTGAEIFGIYPRATSIQGKLDCDGCWWRGPFQGVRCDHSCASMTTILPGELLDRLDDLTGRNCWADTLLTHDRLARLRTAVRETAHLSGDLAELGCMKGGSALAMISACPEKTIHIFDTFAGLPADCDGGGPFKRGDFRATQEEVRATLAGHNAELHPGFFPDSTRGVPERNYACCHFDGDLEASCDAFVRYFWPRLLPGGRLLFDDYKHHEWAGVERSLRKHFTLEQIEESALHQACITKPTGPALVTCWDAAFDAVAAHTWPTMESFCWRHRDWTIRRGPIDASRHPAWSKIPAILAALDAHPFALWLDADALLTGDADPVAILGDADLAIAADKNGLNTGVMVLRACPWVRDWLGAAWELESKYRGHVWHEQPAMVEALTPYMEHVKIVPQRTLNSYPDNGDMDPAFAIGKWEEGDFVLHLAGMSIESRLKFLEGQGCPRTA